MSQSVDCVAIYTEQLKESCRGHPLWFPDIDDTGEIQLGDVGVIFEGRFLRLFNITVPSDSLLNTRSKFGSPEQFEPFEPANVASRELVVYQDIGESVLRFSNAM